MQTKLPEYIEPIRLAASGQVISGKIALSKMHRLVTLLSDTKQDAVVELTFGRDQTGQAVIGGYIDTQFTLVCQRCMQPMSYPVKAVVNLGLVLSHAESNQLPINYEPLIVEEPRMSLATLIEDELLLALPVAAMHPVDECELSDHDQGISNEKPGHTTKQSQSIEQNLTLTDTRKKQLANESKDKRHSNPFALLSDLKIKSKQ
jgi:uncharacterized protein